MTAAFAPINLKKQGLIKDSIYTRPALFAGGISVFLGLGLRISRHFSPITPHDD